MFLSVPCCILFKEHFRIFGTNENTKKRETIPMFRWILSSLIAFLSKMGRCMGISSKKKSAQVVCGLFGE
jgi:hypothetical protein